MFTRWLIAREQREEVRGSRVQEQCFSVPTNLWVQKVQTSLITAVKIRVSPSPISVLIVY